MVKIMTIPWIFLQNNGCTLLSHLKDTTGLSKNAGPQKLHDIMRNVYHNHKSGWHFPKCNTLSGDKSSLGKLSTGSKYTQLNNTETEWFSAEFLYSDMYFEFSWTFYHWILFHKVQCFIGLVFQRNKFWESLE